MLRSNNLIDNQKIYKGDAQTKMFYCYPHKTKSGGKGRLYLYDNQRQGQNLTNSKNVDFIDHSDFDFKDLDYSGSRPNLFSTEKKCPIEVNVDVEEETFPRLLLMFYGHSWNNFESNFTPKF